MQFASAADIAAAQRKPASVCQRAAISVDDYQMLQVPDAYLNSPLVILNNFGGEYPALLDRDVAGAVSRLQGTRRTSS